MPSNGNILKNNANKVDMVATEPGDDGLVESHTHLAQMSYHLTVESNQDLEWEEAINGQGNREWTVNNMKMKTSTTVKVVLNQDLGDPLILFQSLPAKDLVIQ